MTECQPSRLWRQRDGAGFACSLYMLTLRATAACLFSPSSFCPIDTLTEICCSATSWYVIAPSLCFSSILFSVSIRRKPIRAASTASDVDIGSQQTLPRHRQCNLQHCICMLERSYSKLESTFYLLHRDTDTRHKSTPRRAMSYSPYLHPCRQSPLYSVHPSSRSFCPLQPYHFVFMQTRCSQHKEGKGG